jgi:hypothetical protein
VADTYLGIAGLLNTALELRMAIKGSDGALAAFADGTKGR